MGTRLAARVTTIALTRSVQRFLKSLSRSVESSLDGQRSSRRGCGRRTAHRAAGLAVARVRGISVHGAPTVRRARSLDRRGRRRARGRSHGAARLAARCVADRARPRRSVSRRDRGCGASQHAPVRWPSEGAVAVPPQGSNRFVHRARGIELGERDAGRPRWRRELDGRGRGHRARSAFAGRRAAAVEESPA